MCQFMTDCESLALASLIPVYTNHILVALSSNLTGKSSTHAGHFNCNTKIFC